MFTGIVEEIGVVKAIAKGTHSIKLSIKAKKVLENTQLGDSIAVNGVCLTVTFLASDYFIADVMPESMRKTNMGLLKIGDKVNLERALTLSSRLGGHIVSGHIDGTAKIIEMKKDDNAIILTIEVPRQLMKYIVEKGSVAVDGISLTVASLTDNTFSIAVIPHTLKETVLYYKKEGDKVNIENDVIGKYVERLLTFKEDSNDSKKSNITMEFLLKNGF